MGFFDFLTKAQEKLNGLQKRIETFSPEELFKKQEKKPNIEKSKGNKRQSSKSSRPVISAAEQIMIQRDNLKKQGFKEYEFIANRQCCEICGKLNGKHFPLSRLNIGVNAPPMHEGCCCSIAAYSDSKEYEDWLNSF